MIIVGNVIVVVVVVVVIFVVSIVVIVINTNIHYILSIMISTGITMNVVVIVISLLRCRLHLLILLLRLLCLLPPPPPPPHDDDDHHHHHPLLLLLLLLLMPVFQLFMTPSCVDLCITDASNSIGAYFAKLRRTTGDLQRGSDQKLSELLRARAFGEAVWTARGCPVAEGFGGTIFLKGRLHGLGFIPRGLEPRFGFPGHAAVAVQTPEILQKSR